MVARTRHLNEGILRVMDDKSVAETKYNQTNQRNCCLLCSRPYAMPFLKQYNAIIMMGEMGEMHVCVSAFVSGLLPLLVATTSRLV